MLDSQHAGMLGWSGLDPAAEHACMEAVRTVAGLQDKHIVACRGCRADWFCNITIYTVSVLTVSAAATMLSHLGMCCQVSAGSILTPSKEPWSWLLAAVLLTDKVKAH